MKLDEYQQSATSTAIYPGTLTYPALGLCGEVGELADACGCDNEENTIKETGDVLWYVANVANDCQVDLSEVCKRKTFHKKGDRLYWDNEEATIELCVLAGIVAENVKKTIRDNDGELQEKRRKNILRALKQIVEVLAEIVNHIDGHDLESCAKMNIAKLKSRKERGKLKGDGDAR